MVINLQRSWKWVRVPRRLKKHLFQETEWATSQCSTASPTRKGCLQIPASWILLNLDITYCLSNPLSHPSEWSPLQLCIHGLSRNSLRPRSFSKFVSAEVWKIPWPHLTSELGLEAAVKKKKNSTSWKVILLSPKRQYIFDTMQLFQAFC